MGKTYFGEIALWDSELRCATCGDVAREHVGASCGGAKENPIGCDGFNPTRGPSLYGKDYAKAAAIRADRRGDFDGSWDLE
jgi:hypothetical protein